MAGLRRALPPGGARDLGLDPAIRSFFLQVLAVAHLRVQPGGGVLVSGLASAIRFNFLLEPVGYCATAPAAQRWLSASALPQEVSGTVVKNRVRNGRLFLQCGGADGCRRFRGGGPDHA